METCGYSLAELVCCKKQRKMDPADVGNGVLNCYGQWKHMVIYWQRQFTACCCQKLLIFFFLRGCLVVTSLSLFLCLDVEMYSKISACSHWMCLFCFTVPSWSSVMMKMTAETWKKFGECFSPCVAIPTFM